MAVMRLMAILASVLLASCASAFRESLAEPKPTRVACTTYANSEAVLAFAESHVVVFGEMHGTNESVEAFAGVVCAALASGSPVKVGLEAEAWQGALLNQALDPPFDEKAVLEAAPAMWSVEDGRSSVAVMGLLRQISGWRAKGLDVSVFTFDAQRDELDGKMRADVARDVVMARRVNDALSDFVGAAFILAGGSHAIKRSFDFEGERYVPMASALTVRPVLSLKMQFGAGEAWVYTQFERPGGGFDIRGGTIELEAMVADESSLRSFELSEDADGFFSGSYFTGPITASPPAIHAYGKTEK